MRTNWGVPRSVLQPGTLHGGVLREAIYSSAPVAPDLLHEPIVSVPQWQGQPCSHEIGFLAPPGPKSQVAPGGQYHAIS